MTRPGKPKGHALNDAVAPVIRAAFLETGLSQAAFGERVNISQAQLSRYLRGEARMAVDDLDAICHELGLSMVEVLDAADFATRNRFS